MDATAGLITTFNKLSAIARDRVQPGVDLVHFEDKGAGHFDPVTSIDRDIERTMREHLLEAYPGHGVWGEEAGWSNEGARWHWSIDPIDGTRALICGLPTWCTLAGFLVEGRHVAGMIDCPSLGELMIAADGQTLRDGQLVRTSACDSLAHARLATTDPFLFIGDDASAFEALRQDVLLTRYGLDALAYARVATGGLDLVVEAGLKRHDLDALIAVIRGAGGAIGDWSGGEDWDGGRIIAAATRALYDEAVERLAS
jgi:histidinol phosphatase-like enzyme (inositol monophosphatase family)